MRRSGFTLIELLMVISIIAVLAGLLIPLIGYARTTAKNAKCEAQLGTIKASLELYKSANGFYPEKNLGTVFTDASKTGNEKYLIVGMKDDPQASVARGVLVSTDWERVAGILWEALQTVDRDNFRDVNALRDPFTGGGSGGTFFRYRPAKFYPLRPASTGLYLIDSEDPPNPDTYQLWSAGADGKDQYGDRVGNRKSDDIANWKTP